tara:strand:- start:1363 stop:1647 length:285 start_codon:yes stop_codon:yes gene_type:complete
MSEGALQSYFKNQTKKYNVLWRKIKFEGRRGCPDVLIAFDGRAIFVELKNPNKKGRLSQLQVRQIQHMKDAGLSVEIITDKEQVDDVIRKITRA